MTSQATSSPTAATAAIAIGTTQPSAMKPRLSTDPYRLSRFTVWNRTVSRLG